MLLKEFEDTDFLKDIKYKDIQLALEGGRYLYIKPKHVLAIETTIKLNKKIICVDTIEEKISFNWEEIIGINAFKKSESREFKNENFLTDILEFGKDAKVIEIFLDGNPYYMKIKRKHIKKFMEDDNINTTTFETKKTRHYNFSKITYMKIKKKRRSKNV